MRKKRLIEFFSVQLHYFFSKVMDGNSALREIAVHTYMFLYLCFMFMFYEQSNRPAYKNILRL